jgi:hypothetical protein
VLIQNGGNPYCALNSVEVQVRSHTIGVTTYPAIFYTNSDNSTSGPIQQLRVTMICGQNSQPIFGDLVPGNYGPSHLTTTMTSQSACPVFTYNALIAYMVTYQYVFGPLFMLLGLFMALAGRKFFKGAVFLIGAIIVSFFLLTISYQTFLATAQEEWVNWLTMSVAIIVGLACGLLAVKLEKFGACLIAGWAGFCVGILLNESVLYLAQSVPLMWIINVACALVAAALAFFYFNQSIMIATSIVGSFFFVRGLGLMLGNFPSEMEVLNQLESGEIATINPVFYAYLGGIVGMSIICSFVQFKIFDKLTENEKHPYDTMA